ncbi:helix-turn-helix domain-containing protein [Tateyamaria omphalii]|uniref:helix-turn-helix domain-containing protein n=1 Tax=Tateyamaria omphalii TaxID=299262 RepID=UPI001C993C2B|nr:helix-turn-helix domain-containing protein [Tateyamaria omphalii]MBY5935199.1 helix-turn-helix domain-containing protein [Tateyamaria omphalii]
MPTLPFAEQTTPQDVFEAQLNAICGSFDVQHDKPTLTGHVDLLCKGGLSFAKVAQNAKAIHRSRTNIKQDPGNHFFLVLQTEGEALMCQDDADVQMKQGDMFLVDSTRPSTFVYNNQASRQLSLHLPREEATQRFGHRIGGGIAMTRADPLAQAIEAILKDLTQNDRPQQEHVAEAFFAVLGAFLFNRSIGDRSPATPDHQIINRAMQILSQHYADPEFAPIHLANMTGVSLRKLQRAFGSLDTSPHKRIQEVRLDAAGEMLNRLGDKPQTSIASIAFDCGFSDLSTFYRHYKKRHGCAPGERRALQ